MVNVYLELCIYKSDYHLLIVVLSDNSCSERPYC